MANGFMGMQRLPGGGGGGLPVSHELPGAGQQFRPGQRGLPTGEGSFIPIASQSVYTPAFEIPGYAESQKRLKGLTTSYRGRRAEDVRPEYSQFRSGQERLAGLLEQQAMGKGPSVAESQFRRASEQNLARMAALGAGAGRGLPGGLAQRQILQQQAQAGQEAAGQAADIRSQEMLSAREQLGGVLGAGRGQDIENMRTGIQMQQVNDGMVREFVAQGLSLDQAQAQANMGLQEFLAGNQMQREKMQTQLQIAEMQRKGKGFLSSFMESLGGSLGGMAGQAGGMAAGGMLGGVASDKRLKKDIEPLYFEKAKKFLDALEKE